MKKISLMLTLLISSLIVFAQKATPMVDYKGHIIHDNIQIGSIKSTGGYDKKGETVTKVNSNGNIVDLNGKVLGKAPKNGVFEYYFNEKPEKFSIEKPSHNGICKVKNTKGETVLLLHNNYKAQAACAIHCLYKNHCIPNDKEHLLK